jgi:sulfur relay (sulfurtransferase) DsrC/TusE family protein
MEVFIMSNNKQLIQLIKNFNAIGYSLNKHFKIIEYLGRYFIEFNFTGLKVYEINSMNFLKKEMIFVYHINISQCILLDTNISIN